MCQDRRWRRRTLCHWFCKKIWTSCKVWAYAFIQQHYDLGEQTASNTWEDMEKQLNDSLRIEWQYVLHCYLLCHLHFCVKLFLNLIIFCIISCYIKTDYCVFSLHGIYSNKHHETLFTHIISWIWQRFFNRYPPYRLTF